MGFWWASRIVIRKDTKVERLLSGEPPGTSPASPRLQIDRPGPQLNHLARHKNGTCGIDAKAQGGRSARQFTLRNGFDER